MFIRYIYYWNLQFLYSVIIDKTKAPLPRAYMTLAEFGYPVYAISFYWSQNFKLFGFPNFRYWVYLMKVVP
jgi:hypothetical protein